ncbi:MAG TPA: hypothetical protein VFQ51_20635 [Vicinamibacteria bacterium]|nr:hypothetical protein [Vicinamibacteria bacterium]
MAIGPCVLAIVLAGPAGPPSDPDPWSALLGSGLLTIQDTATLKPGRVSLAATIDNRDRDPLGLDIVDGALALRVGLTRWVEAYGQFILNRSVAVPDTPVNPPPPLDQIVPPGAVAPRRPWYSLYSPSPYVDDTGLIHFGAGHPGDALLGLKARVMQPRGARPGLAASFDVRFPLARNLRDLQAGAGTGGTDLRAGLVTEWKPGRWDIVVATGFMHVGTPAYDDRVIESIGGSVVVRDEPLVLPYRWDMGLGLRRELRGWLSAVGEVTTVLETGRRTTSLDRARPVDLMLGLQLRHKSLQMTAALRDHRNALPSMDLRPSPMAGLVDVTRVPAEALSAYLRGIGFAEAEAHLRPRTHRLLVPAPGTTELPPGSRVIPNEYRIRSEHQMGFTLIWAVSF